MALSFGWIILAAGFVGAVRNATAKKYHESDFKSEFWATDEERRTEVPVSRLQQSLWTGVCLLIAIIGCSIITRDDNWNPFR